MAAIAYPAEKQVQDPSLLRCLHRASIARVNYE
jgi:hypothetical protein